MLAGCGGTEIAEAPPPEETTISTAAIDDLTRLACAGEKARAYAGDDPEKNMEILRLSRDIDDLEAAGYACSPEELAETKERAIRESQTPGVPKDKPGALDAAGNPANDSPESKDAAARNKCLEAAYEGLSIEQKTERSREINAEAKAKGVEPADVVGC